MPLAQMIKGLQRNLIASDENMKTKAGIPKISGQAKKLIYFSIISITSGVTPVKLKPPS